MDNSSGGRPQLKKIKRPINRSAPQTVSQSNTNNDKSYVSNRPTSPERIDIDSYLDKVEAPSQEVRNAIFSNDDKDYIPARQTVVQQQPQYLNEDEYEEEVYGRSPIPETPEWLSTKVLFLISLFCLFVGIVAGKFIFAESKVVRNGLQGVVVNGEVPRGRARCGVAERTQGCVLYIMNPQRQDMRAADFYDLASQMTGRQRFMIETGNMRYANTKIRPGEIVQLNIPPL